MTGREIFVIVIPALRYCSGVKGFSMETSPIPIYSIPGLEIGMESFRCKDRSLTLRRRSDGQAPPDRWQ